MERQEGYYWVMDKDGEFKVGYFEPFISYWTEQNTGIWKLHNNETSHEDSDFEYIDEVRIKAPGEMPD